MSKSLFDVFAKEMNAVLAASSYTYSDQEELLKQLFKAEREFKSVLLGTQRGRKVYTQFMSFILNDKNNILAARIYFRERQNTFASKIAKTFDNENAAGLMKFRINYWFVQWVMNNTKIQNKKLHILFEEIKRLRDILCSTNMPLAINRAKIFWSKVPESHLSYEDLIQACSEGLLNAIDKFVPPYREVFRSTAIGRMLSNMIDDYNSTAVKFSPKERRIIYRAKNAKNKEKLEAKGDIVNFVNKSFGNVSEDSLDKLISASSVPVSLNDRTSETLEIIGTFASKDNVEENVIRNEMYSKLDQAMRCLTFLERKVIMLSYGMILFGEFHE